MIYNGMKFNLRTMSDSDAKLVIAAKRFRNGKIIDWAGAKAKGYLKGLEKWPRYRYGARLGALQKIGQKRDPHKWTEKENELLLKLGKKYWQGSWVSWKLASFDPEFKKLPKGTNRLSRQLQVLMRRAKRKD